MEDAEILDLYFARDESAISETAAKYGRLCRSVALNILSVEADADECVNDAYLRAWNAIPPERPERLGVWLGRVVRNLAYDVWKKNHRLKRDAGLETLLEELAECVPSPDTVERRLEERELSAAIDAWLASLPAEDRVLFVRRYWFGEAVKDLAHMAGVPAAGMAKRMLRLRRSLRSTLEKEGYSL